MVVMLISAHIGVTNRVRACIHPAVQLVIRHALGQPDWVADFVEVMVAGMLVPVVASAWMASWLPGWNFDPLRRRSAVALGAVALLLALSSLVQHIWDVDEDGQANNATELTALPARVFAASDGHALVFYEIDANGEMHLFSPAKYSPLDGQPLLPITAPAISQWNAQEQRRQVAREQAEAQRRREAARAQPPQPTPEKIQVAVRESPVRVADTRVEATPPAVNLSSDWLQPQGTRPVIDWSQPSRHTSQIVAGPTPTAKSMEKDNRVVQPQSAREQVAADDEVVSPVRRHRHKSDPEPTPAYVREVQLEYAPPVRYTVETPVYRPPVQIVQPGVVRRVMVFRSYSPPVRFCPPPRYGRGNHR